MSVAVNEADRDTFGEEFVVREARLFGAVVLLRSKTPGLPLPGKLHGHHIQRAFIDIYISKALARTPPLDTYPASILAFHAIARLFSGAKRIEEASKIVVKDQIPKERRWGPLLWEKQDETLVEDIDWLENTAPTSNTDEISISISEDSGSEFQPDDDPHKMAEDSRLLSASQGVNVPTAQNRRTGKRVILRVTAPDGRVVGPAPFAIPADPSTSQSKLAGDTASFATLAGRSATRASATPTTRSMSAATSATRSMSVAASATCSMSVAASALIPTSAAISALSALTLGTSTSGTVLHKSAVPSSNMLLAFADPSDPDRWPNEEIRPISFCHNQLHPLWMNYGNWLLILHRTLVILPDSFHIL
ncbi:hypothetical protein OF83DRAFT_1176282 [Amylostereum chailletii]|nr:hypothetical protein OF83DRAFT_1176282 [Amylostereum chailletii]